MRIARAIAWLCLLGSACAASWALIGVQDRGNWPDHWPKELAPLRANAKTIMVAHGIQEDVHKISFTSAEEFARAWPFLLSVMDRNSQVILENGPYLHSTSGTSVTVGVLMLCPPDSSVTLPDGTTTKPIQARRDLYDGSGGLPEYMALSGGKWKASTDKTGASGFLYRARTDIVVVSDGRIIDANRLAIPKDTTVDDHRGEAGRGAKSAGPDPIDRLIANLASTHGLWVNGMSPIIDLPTTAPVERVLADVFRTTGLDEGHVTSHTIRQVRQVSIPGGFGGPYTAVLTDTNLGPIIVLLRSERPPMGWWSRVVRVEP
jgi:hypothetical protein